MEEKIKTIVSGYLKMPAASITADTLVDRSVVSNSIVLHRMYAKLAEEGVRIENYIDIKNFGELMSRANGNAAISPVHVPIPYANGIEKKGGSAGIDIEEVAALPRTNDFREEEFYKMNFAPSEIAYCILQPDPYVSFAGLFAAKEAIVKADNSFRSRPFHTIVITHEAEGKPAFGDFSLSVSHTNNLAVAVAVRAVALQAPGRPVDEAPAATASRVPWGLWLLCMLLATAALIFAFIN